MDVKQFYSPPEALAPQLWSGVGLTPLQSAFAEAERCQQVLERVSQERISKKVHGSCRRIPCKARGMSTKHNIDTAFFDIPLDAPHGMLLCCSHPECAAAGKRFRFCVVCEMPFAKRNFVKRHGHGIVQSSKELQESDVDELCCPVIPSSSPSITLDNQEVARRLKRVVSFDLTQQRRRKLVEAKDMTMMNGNEHLWLELLRERPDTEDQKKMNSWMDKVISYSEEMRGKSHKPATQEASLLFGKQFTQTEPTPIAPRRTTTPSHEPTGTFNAVSPTTRNADYTDMVCGALRESINEEEVEFAASMGDFDFSALFEDNDPKKEV